MNRFMPAAVPLASSHDYCSPLCFAALWRITPGALSLLPAAVLFLPGGRA